MAIKRSKVEKESPSLPVKLATLLVKGFSFQAVRDQYDAAFKGVKNEVAQFLETTDTFSVDMGKGFKCEQGTVIYESRNNYKFDNDKILALVESGKISIATLVNIARFNATDLQKAIGEKEFTGLAVNTPTEFLVFKASAEFKSEIEETFAAVLPPKEDAPEPVEVVAEAPKKPKAKVADDDAEVVKESLKRVLAAKKSAPSLDDILKK